MIIELIYDRDCPNVADARANLLTALSVAGHELRWTEWERGARDSPSFVNAFGSPTILVDTKDVVSEASDTGLQHREGPCCRLYRNGTGRSAGVPSVEQITAAFGAVGASGWKTSLVGVPGIAIAFLPKLACPLCWPAYAGLLTTLGLGFLLDTNYLLPVTATFLALAIGALAFRASARRGYLPFAFGLAAGIAVLAGKFAFDSDSMMYGGLAAIAAASVWNAWPVRRSRRACRACAPGSLSSMHSTLRKETSS